MMAMARMTRETSDSISVEVSISEFDLTPEELAAKTAAEASAQPDAVTDTESVLADAHTLSVPSQTIQGSD